MPISHERMLSLVQAAQASLDYADSYLKFVKLLMEPNPGETLQPGWVEALARLEGFVLANPIERRHVVAIATEAALWTPAYIAATKKAMRTQQIKRGMKKTGVRREEYATYDQARRDIALEEYLATKTPEVKMAKHVVAALKTPVLPPASEHKIDLSQDGPGGVDPGAAVPQLEPGKG